MSLTNIIKEATEAAKLLAEQNAKNYVKTAVGEKITSIIKEGVEEENGEDTLDMDNDEVTLGADAESMETPDADFDETNDEKFSNEIGEDEVEEEIDLTQIDNKEDLISWIENNLDDTSKFMFVTNMGNPVSIDDVVGGTDEMDTDDFGSDDNADDDDLDTTDFDSNDEDDELEETKIPNTRSKNIMDNKIPNVEMKPVMETESIWKEAANRNRKRFIEEQNKNKQLEERFQKLAENQKKLKAKLNETLEKETNYKKVLGEAKDVITSLALQNTKISQIAAVIQEQNLSVNERKEIIKKFDNVTTIEESTNLYNDLIRETKEAKKAKSIETPSAEKPKIVETTETVQEVITEQKALDKTEDLGEMFNRFTKHKLGSLK